MRHVQKELFQHANEIWQRHRKTVLHTSKPGDAYTSAVVTSEMKDDGNNETIVWPVYSPFELAAKNDPLTNSEVFEIPNQITITEFFEIDGRTSGNHSTYLLEHVKGVSFEKNGNSFGWNIESKELGEWLRQELLDDASLAHILK